MDKEVEAVEQHKEQDAIGVMVAELDRRDERVRTQGKMIRVLIALVALASWFSWRSSVDTQTLLRNEHAASIQTVRQTAADTKAGDQIINKVENQLNTILSDAGFTNRIICQIDAKAIGHLPVGC